MFQLGLGEPLQPQDNLAVTIAGSGVGGQIENGCLVVWYEDCPGIVGRFIDAAELRRRVQRLVTAQATIACGVGGGWTGAEAINAESDLLRANTDYAVLGLVSSVLACAIGVRAPDWGNVRVPIPCCAADPMHTVGFLVRLSERLGLPTIPVFNSGNRANVWLDGLQNDGGADPIISLQLAEVSA